MRRRLPPQRSASPVAAPRLIVGLGNPGAEYEDTRHNAGFWLCERLAAKLGVALKRESRFHGIAGRTHEQTWLLMPQTFMNCSGQAVAALARFYRIPPADMLVLHDELDLPPGALRLKFGGGLGGHNGLKDIAAHLGTQDFWRLRIGVGHPGDRNQVVDYVLKKPRSEERSLIEEALDRALDAWPMLARGEYPAATQKINTRPAPPASQGKP
ncbi:MAG: peptidyl-tRNA hydrolase [Betaproteobacteria bacterium]|nr:MAG: peptidyl-tRNA hydrolase [Betaproteobacteria bacterium]